MTVASDITIVGAGPYGLSLAAHLRGEGLAFRIIGHPMQNWRANMPKGMLLKSAGFASTLYDPGRTFTLERYCSEQGIPYRDLDFPIPLETFCAYGLAFQQRFAPHLELDELAALSSCQDGYELHLKSGRSFKTHNVVLAAGIDYFRHIPQSLAHLPPHLVSHSAEHHDLSRFKGREVAVLGSGASATDLAILLHEAQAKVQLIARKPTIVFGGPWGGASRPLWRRLRAPVSGIGPGWRSRICANAPWLYHYLPESLRVRTVKSHLGPAGGWFMKERAESVPRILGYELTEATEFEGSVRLRLASANGAKRQVCVEHVIAATGFKNDVRRLPFLGKDILDRLHLIDHTPRLSARFESSIPGLYFAGPITALSFGPVMRFAFGANFTARTISTHFARLAAPKIDAAFQKKTGGTS